MVGQGGGVDYQTSSPMSGRAGGICSKASWLGTGSEGTAEASEDAGATSGAAGAGLEATCEGSEASCVESSADWVELADVCVGSEATNVD